MVTDAPFEYLAILTSDLSRTSSLAAYFESVDEPLRGVIWSAREQRWVYRPASIAHFHGDPQDERRTRVIDRDEAERLAQDELKTVIPSEDELRLICAKGAGSEN
jgi:hypothetical protein